MLERIATMLAAGLTIRDIAATLGVHERAVRELVRSGNGFTRSRVSDDRELTLATPQTSDQ